MQRKISIDEIRDFLLAANRQFEQGGIYIQTAHFERTENGTIQGVRFSYEERDYPNSNNKNVKSETH